MEWHIVYHIYSIGTFEDESRYDANVNYHVLYDTSYYKNVIFDTMDIRWAPLWRHYGSIFARHSGGLTLCISY
jgi:hypothetical protein